MCDNEGRCRQSGEDGMDGGVEEHNGDGGNTDDEDSGNGGDCIADCHGRYCGDDGCGGSCGQCPSSVPICDYEGQCNPDCRASCLGRECGDDGCGGSCGVCSEGACIDGTCICSSNEQCGAYDICILGECVAAMGRDYRITFVSGVINERGPDDAAWDPFGGAPDPYLTFEYGDQSIRTSSAIDTTNPVWNEYVDVTVLENQPAAIVMYDEDPFDADDLMGEINLDQIPATALKQGQLLLYNPTPYIYELTISITPL